MRDDSEKNVCGLAYVGKKQYLCSKIVKLLNC